MKKTVVCPTCKTNAPWDENPYRPFCSERCKLIDLGHWLNEDYRFETTPDESDLEELAELLEDPSDGRGCLH